MAAEVIRSEVYSMKADVFSFGLVLYELLTNSYPVRNMEMVMAGRIPPIPEELAKEHNDLVSLIKACCRSNPDKRPSFYRVVRELEVLKAKLMIRRPRKAGGNSGRNIVRH
jgi:serine/threonine protein kinase